jgi:N-acetylneuraminic acid mutarotase
MHSADLIGKMIYIFRGGDGRDYLNDLHSLNTETSTWKLVMADGECCPPPRANHSSAVVKNRLYIFGGWDGIKRLNDLYCFDSDNNLWYEVKKTLFFKF